MATPGVTAVGRRSNTYDVSTADTEEASRSTAGNTAAWNAPAPDMMNPSSASDSKRSDAAHLARELASASWSEAFLPQSYRTLHASETHFQNRERLAHQAHIIQQPHQFTAAMREDFDPPPAYSNREVHELPADPVNMLTMSDAQARTTDTTRATDGQQGDMEEEGSLSAEAPLLGNEDHNPRTCTEHHADHHHHHHHHQHHRRRRHGEQQECRPRWHTWRHRRKTAKHRCSIVIILVVGFCASVYLLGCMLSGTSGKNGWFDGPTKPSQSLVPTGPEYRLHDPTGPIRGLYQLHDRIELSTATGIIDIEIDPQEGDGPAFLMVSSDVGSITVRISPEYLHRHKRTQRPIYTELRSLTGSISADILLGNGGAAYIESTLGTQALQVMTYKVHANEQTSNLTTASTTGTQKINIVSLDQDPVTDLRAEHHAFATGSMDITYPSTWLGELHVVSSPLGTLDIQGTDLEYTEQYKYEVRAHRGPPSSSRMVDIINDGTGSVSFRC